MKKILLLIISFFILSCMNSNDIDFYRNNSYLEFSMNFDFEWLPTLYKHMNNNGIFISESRYEDIFLDGSVMNIDIQDKKVPLEFNNYFIETIFFIEKDNHWGGNLYFFFRDKKLLESFEKAWIAMSEELNV